MPDKKPRKVRKDKGTKRGSLKDQHFMKEMVPLFGPFNPTIPLVQNTKAQQEQAFMDEMEKKHFTVKTPKTKLTRADKARAILDKTIAYVYKEAESGNHVRLYEAFSLKFLPLLKRWGAEFASSGEASEIEEEVEEKALELFNKDKYKISWDAGSTPGIFGSEY